MPVIIVGMVSMFVSPQVGIFVIVLGVMLWTSVKSRKRMRGADNMCEPDPDRRPPAEGPVVCKEALAARSTQNPG